MSFFLLSASTNRSYSMLAKSVYFFHFPCALLRCSAFAPLGRGEDSRLLSDILTRVGNRLYTSSQLSETDCAVPESKIDVRFKIPGETRMVSGSNLNATRRVGVHTLDLLPGAACHFKWFTGDSDCDAPAMSIMFEAVQDCSGPSKAQRSSAEAW